MSDFENDPMHRREPREGMRVTLSDSVHLIAVEISDASRSICDSTKSAARAVLNLVS